MHERAGRAALDDMATRFSDDLIALKGGHLRANGRIAN
jgi:hypothetical protein